MKHSYNQRYIYLICLGLVLVTLVAFEPIRHNDFVDYDDDTYITENPHIMKGVTWGSVKWAFRSTHGGNWHPLTWLSHMVDYQLFGLNPLGHHLMNLLFHTGNTLLLFLVLSSMTRAIWPSAFVAAAFAVHPLHVESVVWVAERKDLLSTFFWMLTMAAYVRYCRTGDVGKYLIVVLFFALGLMAKPMLVTLPFVLLLLDFWPLGRIQKAARMPDKILPKSRTSDQVYGEVSVWQLVIEKIPLLVLVVGSCIVTYLAQQHGGSVSSIENLSIKYRIANGLESYVGYIKTMFYPGGLAVIYPIMTELASTQQLIFSLLQLAGISAIVVYFSRRRVYMAIGWLWYLGTLVPVIGLVQVGLQVKADRYTYVPMIGIFIMVAWGGAEILSKLRFRKFWVAIVACIIIIGMGAGTRRQVSYWRNSFSLFGHAIEATQDNYLAHHYLGIMYGLEGQYEEAIGALKQSANIRWNKPMTHFYLGVAYGELERYQEEIDAYKQAIRIKGDYPEALSNLGIVYDKLGRYEESIDALKQAIRVDADFADAYYNLAAAYHQQGRYSEEIDTLEQVILIKPDKANAHYLQGMRYLLLGDKGSALKEYRILNDLDGEQAKRLFDTINHN